MGGQVPQKDRARGRQRTQDDNRKSNNSRKKEPETPDEGGKKKRGRQWRLDTIYDCAALHKHIIRQAVNGCLDRQEASKISFMIKNHSELLEKVILERDIKAFDETLRRMNQ